MWNRGEAHHHHHHHHPSLQVFVPWIGLCLYSSNGKPPCASVINPVHTSSISPARTPRSTSAQLHLSFEAHIRNPIPVAYDAQASTFDFTSRRHNVGYRGNSSGPPKVIDFATQKLGVRIPLEGTTQIRIDSGGSNVATRPPALEDRTEIPKPRSGLVLSSTVFDGIDLEHCAVSFLSANSGRVLD